MEELTKAQLEKEVEHLKDLLQLAVNTLKHYEAREDYLGNPAANTLMQIGELK